MVQVTHGLWVCRRFMFILEMSDSVKAQTSETGDITSELSSPQREPLTKAHPHQHVHKAHIQPHTLTPSPSEKTHHPAAEPGSSPAEREEGVLSAEPGPASSKTQRPLKTHSCSYLTQRLNSAQQLRSSKRREQLSWMGLGCKRLILCGGRQD